MRWKDSALAGIIIIFITMATNISAEEDLSNEASKTCDELEEECWERCEEIRTEAARKNCEENGYSGCALDVAGCISSPPGSCNLAYGSDYWCEMPGYLACVEPHVSEYHPCLESCNDEFRSGQLDISLAECSGGFNKSLGCTGDIYSGVQDCKNRSCDAYCKQQGMVGGEWVYYNATLGGYDRCQCALIPVDTEHPIMRPTPEELQTWIAFSESIPDMPGTISAESMIQLNYSPSQLSYSAAEYGGVFFSLLPYLQYDPDERNQGRCSNCWQWAGTAIMEIQLAYRMNILDSLSVQYINSDIEGPAVKGEPCCGDWIDTFAEFYLDRMQAIPWTNSNAGWMDGASICDKSIVAAGSTSTSPSYTISSIRVENIPTYGIDTTTAINNIKKALHQGKAVWFVYMLPDKSEWNNFRSFWDNQPEDVVIQLDTACGIQYNNSEGEGGGHAVAIVGYDDTDPNNRYWIVLNSWGTADGLRPNGLFRVSMDMNYDCQYPNPPWSPLKSLYFHTLDIVYSDQGRNIQVPIDRNGSRSLIPPSNPLYLNVDGVDYTLETVLYADSPDCPLDAAGSELPQEIDIDVQSLGLKNVEMVYMATQSAWSPDLPDGIKVGEVIFDYEDGGPSSTLDLIMGENIAEWSWEHPESKSYHSMPPIIWSWPTTLNSNQEYMGHSYATSIRLDATRTLSRIRLNVVDANSLLPYRKPGYGPLTWIGVAVMALTLEGDADLTGEVASIGPVDLEADMDEAPIVPDVADEVDELLMDLKYGDDNARQSAAEALGDIGDPRAVDPLIEALNDENEYVRAMASNALGCIGDPRAVDPLIEALNDEDETVRYYAAWALGVIGDLRAVDPLIETLSDEDVAKSKMTA